MKPPASRASRQPRRGFLLPAVLLVLCLIVLLAATRHFFSREHLNMAAHLADYERAYHAANGALLAGRDQWRRLEAWFNSGDPGTFPKRDRVPADLKAVCTSLLDGSGLPPEEGVRFAWEDPLLADLAAGQPEAAPPQVEFELRPAGPLFTAPPGPGLRPDPRERQYHLFVHATARVGDATCRLCWYRSTKLINILPPVVGKFALFIREPGALDANRLADSSDLADLHDAPLVVRGGAAIGPGPRPPAAVRDALDRRGWVFLGGGARWALGLSSGGGEPRFADAMMHDSWFSWPLDPSEPLSRKGDFVWYVETRPLGRQWREAAGKFALAAFPGRVERSSILNLNGTAADPAPTLVVGNVSRQWALIQGLLHPSSGKSAHLPWLSRTLFAGDAWPGVSQGRTITDLRDNFGGSYDAYERRMSDVAEEPYNAGLFPLMDFPGDPFARVVVIDPAALPPGLTSLAASQRLRIDGQPALPGGMAYGSAYTLLDDEGREWFSGGDLGALGDLSFLRRRVTLAFPDLAGLRRGLPRDEAGDLLLPGAVLVGGPVTIEEPLRFANGGLVLVDGTIRLQGEVGVAGGGEPLSLVSLGGDIEVETAAPLGAALIALAGRVTLPREVSVKGLVAARELGLAVADPPTGRQIEYDDRYDPTTAATRQRAYRLQGVGEEVFLVH
ncbi:MAG: hypothetical protein GX442_20145 [Candidatus Riflebacteria bacterium]|nr:hypothetical protein [Candidatus Riflebacteria bacterium]